MANEQKTQIPRRNEDAEFGVVTGRELQETAAVNGAVLIDRSKTVYITKAGVCALTLGVPPVSKNGLRITFIATTANAHTVTAAIIGFNALDGAGDIATFGGAVGDGFSVEARAGEWWVVPGSNLNVTIA